MNQHNLFQPIWMLFVVIATIAVNRDYLLLHRVRLADRMAGGKKTA